MKRYTLAGIVAGAFLGCIIAANYVTTRYGFVPVGFGVQATAGTYFAGLAFVLRDTLQDAAGKRAVLGVIVAGAALSYLVSAPFIALASGLAFLVSETVDLGIYTPLRERGYLRAAVASNLAGSVVDTVLFLWVAGFPIWASFSGQMLGKLSITLAVVLLVATARAAGRKVATA